MDITTLVAESHDRSKAAGWWHDPITGLSLIPGKPGLDTADDVVDHSEADPIIKAWFPYVVATKIALIHSEVSEGLEAYRRSKVDDKMPPWPGITMEMADVMIRVGDLIGMLQANADDPDLYDLETAIKAKFGYNDWRPDHKITARLLVGGKLF